MWSARWNAKYFVSTSAFSSLGGMWAMLILQLVDLKGAAHKATWSSQIACRYEANTRKRCVDTSKASRKRLRETSAARSCAARSCRDSSWNDTRGYVHAQNLSNWKNSCNIELSTGSYSISQTLECKNLHHWFGYHKTERSRKNHQWRRGKISSSCRTERYPNFEIRKWVFVTSKSHRISTKKVFGCCDQDVIVRLLLEGYWNYQLWNVFRSRPKISSKWMLLFKEHTDDLKIGSLNVGYAIDSDIWNTTPRSAPAWHSNLILSQPCFSILWL